MWNAVLGIIRSDIKKGFHSWSLFLILVTPVLLILLMLFAVPWLAGLFLSGQGVDLYRYYSLIGISTASLIPVFAGLFYALVSIQGFNINASYEPHPQQSRTPLQVRIISAFLLCLVYSLLFVFTADPVPGEGWIRNSFAAILFALQAPFVFLLFRYMAGRKKRLILFYALCFLLVAALPVGLLLRQPWHYFTFLSPFYWIGWAWVIEAPLESMAYGAISIIITALFVYLPCRLIFARILK